MRRHIRHQRYLSHIRHPEILHATYCFVSADMYIGRTRIRRPLILRRYIAEMPVLGCGDNIRAAILARLLNRLFRPLASIHIIRRALITEQIHRNQRIHSQCATLQKQDLIIGWDIEQRTKISDCFLDDGSEFFTAVTHLHHRHTATVPVEHFIGGTA